MDAVKDMHLICEEGLQTPSFTNVILTFVLYISNCKHTFFMDFAPERQQIAVCET